jgi:hypothetical protein
MMPVGVGFTACVAAYSLYRLRKWWPRLKKLERPFDPVLGGVLFFTFAVGPFLGFANFGFQAAADRFTYVPSIGLSILLPALADKIAENSLRHVVTAISVCACVALGIVTWHQTGYWENDLKLFSHVLEVDGEDNFVAVRNLASYYFEIEHDPAKVIAYTERCKKMDWDGAGGVYSPYIIALCELGEVEKANEELSEYMRWTREAFEDGRKEGLISNGSGRSIPLLHATAAVAVLNGDYDLAEMHLSELRQNNPDDVMADYIDGHMHKKRGDEAGARACWKRIADNRKDDFFWFRWMKK